MYQPNYDMGQRMPLTLGIGPSAPWMGIYKNQQPPVVQGLGPELDENAIEAVKQWIFKPAYRNGKPIGTPMPVNVQVEFRL